MTQQPLTLRAFDDTEGLRNAVFDSVHRTASNLPSVQNSKYTLTLTDVDWADNPEYTSRDVHDARLQQKSLGRRLQGTWNLIDTPTGNVIQRQRKTVANVPYVQNDGSVMDAGNAYFIRSQQRLKRGVYTQRKENGELVTNVNTAAHHGPTHSYNYDPTSGRFNIEVGNANIPMYTFMSAMGATDDELREYWGEKVLEANKAAAKDMNMRKLYDKFVRKQLQQAGDKDDDELMRQRIREQAAAIRFSREVNRATLDDDREDYDKQTALRATAKLLKLSRDEVESDSRDNMAFQSFMGPEDLFAERLQLDDGRVRRQMLNKLTFLSKNKPDLSKIPSGLLTKQINSVITQSGLASPAEEINPFELSSKLFSVTRMGEGAIGCHTDETDVFTYEGWKNWGEVTENDLFGCCIEGKLEFHRAERLIVADYSGKIYGYETDRIRYAVTPEHRMWVRVGIKRESAQAKSDYKFETAAECHSKQRIHRLASDGYDGGDTVSTFCVAGVDGISPVPGFEVDAITFAEFIGYYLADGFCTQVQGNYRVILGKLPSDPAFSKYKEIFERIGYRPMINKTTLRIHNKALYQYVLQFGKSADKFVPDWIKYGSRAVREAFLSALFAGDGSRIGAGVFQYSSSSSRLRDDAAYIAVTLGKAIRFKDIHYPEHVVKATGEVRKGGVVYAVRVLPYTETTTSRNSGGYRIKHYKGKVYCATVPGGLLLTRYRGVVMWSGNSEEAIPDSARQVNNTQYGFIDPLQTPESLRVGVDCYISSSAMKGSDGNLYVPVIDARTGQQVYKNPVELMNAVTTLQSEWNNGEQRIAGFDSDRQPRMGLKREAVDFIFPNNQGAYNNLSNLVPMLGNVKGQRVAMAARMLTQTLPLEGGEAPLVQSRVPGTEDSYEERVGRAATVMSRTGGTVRAVTDNEIVVDTPEGERKYPLLKVSPSNRKTYRTDTPLVKPGQTIKPGQILAKSNFTDDNGAIAQGMNVRAVMGSWRGTNTMDAIIISQSMADRMKSQHAYQNRIDFSDNVKTGKGMFVGAFPSIYDKVQLENIEDNGIVRIGTQVHKGDPLVLKADVNTKPVDRIHRKGATSLMNSALEWDHDDPGVVTDVSVDKNGVNVVVSSLQPTRLGDKIANRFGAKGVVSEIVPDDQMPQTSEGPAEIVYNPIGNISRVNYGMLHEHLLSRIAKKTGKPIKIESFDPSNPDMTAYVMQLAKEHGIDPREAIIDPETGKPIGGHDGKGLGFGYSYVQKLHHSAEGKEDSRSFGRYTADGMPAPGGESGSKRVALMHVNSLISHGAYNNLLDARRVRGQKNDEYWSAFMRGYQPPEVEQPPMYHKFMAHLSGSGINVIPQAGKLKIMALTNEDVKEMAGNREVQNSETVMWEKDKKGIVGGLFDPRIFGEYGDRWGYIKPAQPVLNPVMEEPARRMLGLTQAKLEAVIAGRDELGVYGTGPKAIRKALQSINVDEEMRRARAVIADGRGSKRDEAVKKLQFLSAAQKNDLKPGDWVLDRIPVIPPKFRPVSEMSGSETALVSDANYLYKQFIDHNDAVKELEGQIGDAGEEHLQSYNYFKQITGLMDPTHPKLQQKRVQGLLKHIFGDGSAKYGMVQRSLLGGGVDNVARGVITMSPNLDLDEVGLPIDSAYEVYKPIILRKLVQGGVPLMKAQEMFEAKDRRAKQALLQATKERPVILDRSPVLHKYGMMAFWPRLVRGRTIQMNQYTMGGFGADLDGNCCAGETEIFFRLSRLAPNSLCATLKEERIEDVSIRQFLSDFKGSVMRVGGQEAVDLLLDGKTVCLPIQEFPRVGTPVKDKNGADMFAVPPGVETLSYDVNTGEACWCPVTLLTVEDGAECATVTTTGGREVTISANESLVAYDPETGGLEKIKPSDAQGRLVPVLAKPPTQFGSNYSYAIGWWYGSLISDGWVTDRTVGYAKLDDAKREKFVEIARKEICENFCTRTYEDKPGVKKLGKSKKVHLNGCDLAAAVFQCVDLLNKKPGQRSALHKFIPEEILEKGTRECLLGLLAGLLEGDGTMCWNTSKNMRRAAISFSTSSRKLCESLRRLCYKLGIRLNVITVPPRGLSTTTYAITFSIPDMWRIYPELMFFGGKEQEFHKEFCALPEPKDDRDIVPLSREEATQAIKALTSNSRAGLYFYESKKRGYVSRAHALDYLSGLPEAVCPVLRRHAANKEVLWEKYKTIASVEPRQVFDIAVDGTKVFVIGNGLVVYDTVNFQVPISNDAAEEAKRLMLPSQNLLGITDRSPNFTPQEDYIQGLFSATLSPKKKGRTHVFATMADLKQAYARGEVSLHDDVEILKKS